MAITAGMVKELRERSGAGMMDCKNALAETNGDIDKAIEYLREKGLAKAAKKAGRIAAEGLVAVCESEDGKTAALVEVNSETDFVAKNDLFKEFVAEVAKQALQTNALDVESFKAEAWALDPSKTVEEVLNEKIAVIGENLSIRRFEKVVADNGAVVSYIHGGGRIGVLVEVVVDGADAAVVECAKNLAMQVAAIAPKYVSSDEIPEEYKESEKNILTQQAMNENPDKPANIIEKMIIGRLNKQLKEICLLEQAYVKDGDLTVAKYLEQVSKEAGKKVSVKRFVRFETGEGIEKKEENFAEEVAKQMGM
ncbi:translation elongation factor Ts [Anaerotalea alkaliphila]|uniref:Elongation factor Ts n=1 Tax=Anaerotalea alkaliphila TaxID=2662126 RepID=A0A7X5HT30_9FIRM|nr:translation elongation factor Ts [Anaerotalea alkaliphila]NDL66158.1 elongation factor Ts [Anaerotalea alkaliphila]